MFTYPPADKEVEIIAHEAGVSLAGYRASKLAVLGEKVRHLKASGLEERRLDPTADLRRRADPPGNCATARGDRRRHVVAWATDEVDSKRAIDEVVKAIFP